MKSLGLAMAGLALLSGCGDDSSDDSGEGDPASLRGGISSVATRNNPELLVEFFDDFSGGFPRSWEIKKGEPFIVIDEGDAAPALTFGPVDGNIHVRTSDTFSASGPFTFSVDLSAPAVTFEKARFKIRLDFGDDEEDGDDNDDTFFEVRLNEPAARVHIRDESARAGDVAPGGGFHRIEFRVDENRVASWSLDGEVLMSRGGFASGSFRVDLRSRDRGAARFVVDNVSLTRP